MPGTNIAVLFASMESPDAHNVRRPRIVARYAAQVAQWLRESPAISATELPRRAQAVGYSGGKSALFELVRRLRPVDARPEGWRQLIVVAPDREHLYNLFSVAFAGNATVLVIRDRRVVNRRQHAEYRKCERRRLNRRKIDGTLRAEGWTIVRLRTSNHRRQSPLKR
jgi:hypothetical protein